MTTRALHERAERLRADRIPFVHARVVLAEKPTSAKPGDEALVLMDGTIEGFVGGQCAQATVRAQGLELMQRGETMLLRIAPNPEPDQSGKTVVHNACLSGGTLEIFMESVLPAPVVHIEGSSPIADAMAVVGSALGYDVQPYSGTDLNVVDAVLIASHGFGEEPALTSALAAGVPYVGMIASPKRAKAVLESLDIDPNLKSRIHAPAGLDIGARTPEEVALSVFAQIIEERRAPSRIRELPLLTSAPAAAGTAIDPICQMTVAAVPTSI
ncbi:MAG: cytochrome oxidase I, partial [Actinobacteria bacterium]|nr:cytochrome oxidase I [Actinomycetota bacterium]